MKIATIIDRVFLLAVRSRNQVVFVLNSINWIAALVLVVGSYSTYVRDSHASEFYNFARECGEYAIVLFILVSIPGITRRFQYNHKLIMLLMMFRRQIGVLTYMLILIHSFVLQIIPWIAGMYPVLPMELFVVFGVIANSMLFLLFITSNDWSVKRLGDWWTKIHDLMYIIVWCIFAHVTLQSISKWTILIGVTAITQLASHIYAARRLRSLN